MEQAILSEKQKKAITVIGRDSNMEDFYLTGGTALSAFYFNHRISDDLDLFTFKDPDALYLHSFVEKLKTEIGAKSLRFERLYDRNIFFFNFNGEELKVEFSKYPFHQLEKPIIKDNIKIDSLRDIAANKLMAVLDRFDPKDFIDLFFLLKEFQLENIRADAEKKFGLKIDNIFLGGELAKVKRIEALPKMLKNISIKELKEFFAQKAKQLEPEILE